MQDSDPHVSGDRCRLDPSLRSATGLFFHRCTRDAIIFFLRIRRPTAEHVTRVGASS